MGRNEHATPMHRRTKAVRFYRSALSVLSDADVPFLVGGGYAVEMFTGIQSHKKDLDIFLLPPDVQRAVDALQAAGYHSEIVDPVWLAKAYFGSQFIDMIFNANNAICPVDEQWFTPGVPATIFDMEVRLCAPEEVIWQKCFLMARDRYDGADVAHLLLRCGEHLDWERLLRRFGSQWRVLYSHLILFGFIYPNQQQVIPTRLMENLAARLAEDIEASPVAERKICHGALLGRDQYHADVEQWGYEDARGLAVGALHASSVPHTAAVP